MLHAISCSALAPPPSARTVWLGISLHTTPNIPAYLEPEIAPVTAGVETDVLGIGYDNLTPQQITEVTSAHPRPDFKNRILKAFTDGNIHRPRSTLGNVNADVLEHFDPSFKRDDFVETHFGEPLEGMTGRAYARAGQRGLWPLIE